MKKKSTKTSPEAEFIARVRKAVFENDNSEFRDIVDNIMDNTGETAAEIAAALVGMLLKPEKKQKERIPKKAEEKPKKKEKKAPVKTSKLVISAGLNRRFTHKDIAGALIAHTGIHIGDIREIELLHNKTFFRVPSKLVPQVISGMNKAESKIKGVPVRVHIAKDK